jgi:peptide/nickel transport system substrate-binding protein
MAAPPGWKFFHRAVGKIGSAVQSAGEGEVSMRSNVRTVSRRRLIGGAALGASGLWLAACGGGKSDSGAGAGTSSPASGGTGAAAQQPQKEPVRGGALTFSIGGDPPSFDVHSQSTYLVSTTMAPVYNQLVRFDPKVVEEPLTAIVGDLAKSWEQNSEGTVLTFKLNDGVSFHDGKACTSADVKATLERMIAPPKGVVSPRQDSLAVIERIETPDPGTVVLNLKQPAPSLLPILAQGWMSIYAAQDIAANFDYKLKTNGTGPFKLKEYTRGSKLVLEANPNYFIKGQPYLSNITAFIQVDAGARVSAFQSGQTNFSLLFTESDMESLEAAIGNKIKVERLNGYGFNTLNFGHNAPWTDERVRRALALSIDRQESIDLLYEGKGFHGGYMPGGGGWALTKEELERVPGYAPYSDKTVAEAKQLLQAAGVKQGHQTTMLTRRGVSYENHAVFLKDQLARVGITATPKIVEDAAAYEALDSRAYDLAPWGHAIALDDPDAVFAEFYLTKSPRNYSGVGSAEVDAIFAKQSRTLDLNERKKLVNEMQQKALPLYGKLIQAWSTRRWTWWNSVQGYTPHVGLYNNNRHELTWVEK